MAAKRPVDITILHVSNIKRSRTVSATQAAYTAVLTIDGHDERFVTNPAFGDNPVWKARHMFFVDEELISGDEPSTIRVDIFDSPQLENHLGAATINIETAMDFYNKAHAYPLLSEQFRGQGSVTVAVSIAPKSRSSFYSVSISNSTPHSGPLLSGGESQGPNSGPLVGSGTQPTSRPQNGFHGITRSYGSASFSEGTRPMGNLPVPSPTPNGGYNRSPPPGSTIVAGQRGRPTSISQGGVPPAPESNGQQMYYSVSQSQVYHHTGSHQSSPHYGPGPSSGPHSGPYPTSLSNHQSPQNGTSPHQAHSTSPGYLHGAPGHGSHHNHQSSGMFRTTSDSALNRPVRSGRRNQPGLGNSHGSGNHGGGAMDGGGIVEGVFLGAVGGIIAADIIDDI